jgi:dihydrodiol dehydrogenase / D-xylose 1-dehydrogenase (NADP)
MTKINWGILGCGGIAQKFAQALQQTEGAVMYAAAARDGERAATFARQWGFEKSIAGYRALVSDPDVDIIYIATPHSYHYAHARLCLEAGKHVLCEKPITVNAGQLQELIKLARERKLFLMEALWTRFLPGIIKIKEMISAGVIGEVVTMDVDFGINIPYDAQHRIYNPLLAGGALLDIGIYPLFLALYLFGKPSVIKAHSLLNKNKIDLTTSIIAQSKSGTMCNLNSTTQANTPIKARISGTKGFIELEKWWFTPVDITLNIEGKDEEILKFPPISNGYEYEAMEAIRCLNDGKTESDIMPFAFSLMLMEQMDEIRKMTGITYPKVIEDVKIPYGWNEL